MGKISEAIDKCITDEELSPKDKVIIDAAIQAMIDAKNAVHKVTKLSDSANSKVAKSIVVQLDKDKGSLFKMKG